MSIVLKGDAKAEEKKSEETKKETPAQDDHLERSDLSNSKVAEA